MKKVSGYGSAETSLQGQTKMSVIMSASRKNWAAAVILLVLLAVIRYFPHTDSFWLYDDPSLLKQVILHHPWEYFFVPSVWRLSSASNFTPWVLLSLSVDWALFGLWPMGFYLHQLLSICLLSLAACFVLRERFSPGVIFMGLSLFLLSPPFAESAHLLMERHYIEGLLLSLVSVYMYREGVKKDSTLYGWVGALFYLAATTAKEIYVPLLFLLPFLVKGPRRKRVKCLLPWVVSAAVYVVWRRYMLGRFVGGYGLEFMWSRDLLLLPGRLISGMGASDGGISWWTWLMAGSFLASLVIIFIKDRKQLYAVTAGAILMIAPIVPVSPIMSPRYVWLLFFGVLLVQMMAWEDLKIKGGLFSKSVIWLWYGVLAIGFFYMAAHARLGGNMILQRTEGRFVLDRGSVTDLLVKPAGSGWYYDDLSWIRTNVLHLPAGPSVISDDRILCFERETGDGRGSLSVLFMEVWQFDQQKGAFLHENIDRYTDEICGKGVMNTIHPDSPLYLHMTYGNSTVKWQFGPYREGRYSLFLGRTSASLFPLPRRGERFVSFRGQKIYFRLRYVSPDGWSTYSPLLKLNVSSDDHGTLKWERRGTFPKQSVRRDSS